MPIAIPIPTELEAEAYDVLAIRFDYNPQNTLGPNGTPLTKEAFCRRALARWIVLELIAERRRRLADDLKRQEVENELTAKVS